MATIELPVDTTHVEIDPDVFATALAPYVAAVLQPAVNGAFRSIQQVKVPPAATSLQPSTSFAAVPGFSVSATLQAGNKAIVRVTGRLNTQCDGGDFAWVTLWRQIAGGAWFDLTPSGVDCIDDARTSSSAEMHPFVIEFLDDTLSLTGPTQVTYLLAAKAKNGALWIGRRFDDALRSLTVLTLTEVCG